MKSVLKRFILIFPILSNILFELNTVTEGELKRLPFLSIYNTELLGYRSRYGKMLTLYELKNVEAFDLETISLFIPFVYIGEIIVDKRTITVKNLLKRSTNNLQIRYDRCFSTKERLSFIS